MQPEFRQVEIRAEGNAIVGTAIRYGDRAEIAPGVFETFQPGSLAWDDVILNRQHRRDQALARTGGAGLALIADDSAVRFRAELPDTQDARDTRALVAAGVLRGASIEFRAERERMEGSLRVIEAARLKGIAIVDEGAYPESTVEARARWGGNWFRARIPFRTRLGCDCHRGRCGDIEIAEDAFDESLKSGREILAVTGTFDKAVASASRGTLRLTKDKDGLIVEMDRTAASTPAGRELAETMRAVPISARPIFDQDLSEFVEGEGADAARYGKMHLRAILLKATPDNRGWPEGEIVGGGARREARRRRVWL